MTTGSMAGALAGAQRVAIVANGPPPSHEFLRRHLRGADAVLACDGAARIFIGTDLPLHGVVGDMDSLEGEMRARLSPTVAVEKDPDQNTFDLEKALNLVFRCCPETVSVRLFGAWGGRIDHSIANVMLLSRHPQRDVRMLDPGQEFFFATANGEWGSPKNRFAGDRGTPVSLLPFGRVVGVESRGLRWSLEGRDLGSDGLLGNSNEASEGICEVRFTSGILGICVGREPEPWGRE